jgi:hypothetical protein
MYCMMNRFYHSPTKIFHISATPHHFFQPHSSLEIAKGQIRADTSVFHKLFPGNFMKGFMEIRSYLPFAALLNFTGSICFFESGNPHLPAQ